MHGKGLFCRIICPVVNLDGHFIIRGMSRDPTPAQGQALVIGAGLGGLASAMRLGAKGFLAKPINKDDLLAKVRITIATSRRAREREALGHELPAPNPAVGEYVGAVTVGNIVFVSGHGPYEHGRFVCKGKLGRDVDVPTGQAAAALTIVNLLASLKAEIGELDRVRRVVKLLVLVNSDPEFGEQPAVANGASDLLVAVLGSSHARLREAHRKLQDEIDEREKAEAALRQAQKMEAMGQLTGGVAHDFNNLLMVASSGLDLMDRTTDLARRERLKQGIRQAIDRGASLTQQLLAFARRAPVHPEVLDLGSSLRGMQNLLDRSLREDIAIEVKPAPDLWPVEVDPSQLEVAILNCAINARDAMPAGGRIVIRAENLPAGPGQARDMVKVCIIDTGVGMAPDMVSRVFEPFFTTKGVGQGTGLGLSQVYGFARSSGGDVSFESAEGEGSTVCIRLPRSDKAPPVPVAPTIAVAGDNTRRCKVLLVEDDDNVAGLVEEMLEELGYDAVRAPNAVRALDTLETQPAFDLVFSDMVMPGEMDGLALAEEIADRRPDLPIVLTTGYSNAAASAAAKGIRLLVKPYRIEALASELQTALSARADGARR